MSQGFDRGIAKLIVTSPNLYAAQQTISALRTAVPGARVRGAGFSAIFILEAEGDATDKKAL